MKTKKSPVKTIPGMGEERIKESDGWVVFNYDILQVLL
jgi:hypothetical protein